MKKSGILHKDLNTVIASLGHMDTIIICDAGLPIPNETQRVELAFMEGIPGILEVLDAVLDEVVVEGVYMAAESKEKCRLNGEIEQRFKQMSIEYIPHAEFKEMSKSCKAIIRTGEFTPYSNVLLVCGCAY
jgi:D-ribose pyranase